ncbi:hypothetical protein Ciccas_003748 [Cichlidogyrus casuarinus]|uniref:Major facilitator superfamily (MFS) profile domain-containing protein n=1 Tax=Cichlidogyrus casuarinus TaxID=1844966 RepID=A0ABD2QDH2_9PLAT
MLLPNEAEHEKELPHEKPSTQLENSTYTVEQAVENAGFGLFQIKIILITGLLTACDAMEMLLLSVLGPALRCVWHLSSHDVATITTAVFVGFLFGAPCWGYFADRFGRKITYSLVLTIIAYFGFLTAVSPTYIWLVFLRTVIGFAIGGASSSSTLLSEYLPAKYRARGLMSLQVFWALGGSFEVAVAYMLLPYGGWRWYLFASAVPMFVSLISLWWLPESTRFLAASNRINEAEQIVLEMHYTNKVKLLPGRLVQPQSSENPGSFKTLFAKDYLKTTLMLPVIWFAAAFNYYGVVLLSSTLLTSRPGCYSKYGTFLINGSWIYNNALAEAHGDTSCCQNLTNDDYIAMLTSSLGEFPVIPLTVLAMDFLGRRRSMSIALGLESVLFALLIICMDKIPAVILLLILRALASGHFNICYTYTLECYPTVIRSLAVGIFSSIARIGAMTTPYVAQVMLPDYSLPGALSLYSLVCVIAGIFSLLLPIETLGRGLPQSAGEVEISYKKPADSSPRKEHELKQ